jgi:Rod binding domain-containing protein
MISATTSLVKPAALGDCANTARGSAPAAPDKIEKVASDFESLFTSQLLKEMRKSLDPETMFGGDGGDVYGGMFDQFVGQQMAQSGGFGLAKMLREALHREQQSGRLPITNVAITAPRAEPNRQTAVGEAAGSSRGALTARLNGKD